MYMDAGVDVAGELATIVHYVVDAGVDIAGSLRTIVRRSTDAGARSAAARHWYEKV
jgi:hypothetical protein